MVHESVRSLHRSRRLFTCLVAAGVLATGLSLATQAAAAQTLAPLKKHCANGGTCVVGSKGPGGGIVFMTPATKGNTTGKYFEAAPKGWSGAPADPRIAWCSNTAVSIPAARGAGIGAGAGNTDAMVASCTSGAANLARGYTGGGKTDWFLPSQGELDQMWKRRAKGGYESSPKYWSSTETSPGGEQFLAWSCGLTRYATYSGNHAVKDGVLYVRPVRSF
jgi:hypothetical protein